MDDPIMSDSEPLSRPEALLRKTVLVISRLVLAYLFFSQLFWKLPPTFGCRQPDFAFTTATVDDAGRLKLQRTSGLCDWLGIEQIYATRPRPVLVTNLDNQGSAELSVDIGLLAKLNGLFVERVVMPGIVFWGWLIFLAEAWIVLSLFFGLFSRLGALVAIAISAQLFVGLAGIPNPPEWEWSYSLMVLLSLVLFAFPPGRVLGVDAWLRPSLRGAAARGSRLARVLGWLT